MREYSGPSSRLGVTHFSCALPNPSWTLTEEGTPGKRDVLNPSRKKSASVRSARLKEGMSQEENSIRGHVPLQFGRIGSLMGDDDRLESWVITDIP